jgi:hypothetical protein
MDETLYWIGAPNVDPRRRQELADSNMIFEDHTKVANLSPRVINRQFDANRYPERLAMYNQSQRRIR